MTSAVVLGKGVVGSGQAARGPIGTTYPDELANAFGTLPMGMTKLGIVSEEGVTESESDTQTNIVGWDGEVARVIRTEHTLTYAFSLIETTAASLGTVYGDANIKTAAATGLHGNQLQATIRAREGVREVWRFALKDGDRKGEIWLPAAEVTERGDIQYVSSDAIKYSVTLTAYGDPQASDPIAKAFIFWDDGVLDSGSSSSSS